TDGALPENKGRGSVVRGILRRAVRFGWQCFGAREPFLYELVPAVVEPMKAAFPELGKNPGRIAEIIRTEEADFLRTIERGRSRFEQAARKAGKRGGPISGEDAFELHQTHGFPPDLTQQMAHERSLQVDMEEYRSRMEQHAAISKAEGGVQVLALNVSGL